MKVYLDTCVISGLVRSDIKTEELQAALEMLAWFSTNRIEMVTSNLAEAEIAKIPPQYSAPHQKLYQVLDKIPRVVEARADPGMALLGVSRGMIPMPLLQQLKTVLPDLGDALHIFTAVQNQCTHFVTVDVKTIISKRELIKQFTPIAVCMPSELKI